jgi:hypothetical protein
MARTAGPSGLRISSRAAAIAPGDTSPSPNDHTDFGRVLVSAGPVTRTFTISNNGTAPLTLTGSLLVAIAGPAAADFSLVVSPTTPLAPGQATSFRVAFSPSLTGTRAATLTIANDSYHNPYDFTIQGTGTWPTYLPLVLKWNAEYRSATYPKGSKANKD